ncbi:hypothetical protein [Tumebacillus sp. BK434]|uniref:hypothetical protein n=1 Tax=Tumebacillus sp. BK434 TaxID=2512169 RepID=UPI00104329A0|nr:hypothetical protein [Tumebacillus sp. BK434]
MLMRINFVLAIALAALLFGCSDPSPLKSDLEVAINQTFGMQFDYLDHVQVFKVGNNTLESLADIKGENVRGIILTLSKAKLSVEEPLPKTFPYKIVLSTSPEGLEYNKKQTTADLLVYQEGEVTHISYNNRHYVLKEDLSSYGIE